MRLSAPRARGLRAAAPAAVRRAPAGLRLRPAAAVPPEAVAEAVAAAEGLGLARAAGAALLGEPGAAAGAVPNVQNVFEVAEGYAKRSYFVNLGLFLITVPGLYSLVKRAPKATVKRLTFEEPGPAAGGRDLDVIARGVAAYFKKYNYRIAETGETITFEGTYQASRGQAAAITFYFFVGLACIALVLSVTNREVFGVEVGEKWYGLTLLTPVAWWYYFQNGTRDEQVRIKMVTNDDDTMTDLTVEGDREEIERMRKELGLMEKGKVYVKGILEQ